MIVIIVVGIGKVIVIVVGKHIIISKIGTKVILQKRDSNRKAYIYNITTRIMIVIIVVGIGKVIVIVVGKHIIISKYVQ